GETGVGKSSVLEFIANVIAGNPISKYKFNIIDESNEAGGSGKHSQTNSAKTYILESANGHTVRILDTPGLADTRGIEQDEKHKRSIANEIANNITTVTGVIILANGTVPRITVGTDYALSTLSSIFPRSLADNIAFMFTNVPNPLSWNFAQDTIPEVLKHAPQFRLDNPLALRKKYLELKNKPNTTSQLRKEMRATVNSGEAKALEMLVRLFDWLDGCVPQPTKDIMSLYDQSQRIETRISNILASTDQLAGKRNELQKIANETEKAKSNMSIFKDFETIANREEWVQNDTKTHNTLCSVPQCYSNCHIDCQLDFTLDPQGLKGCAAMWPSGGDTCVRQGCGHDRTKHKHFHVMWEKEKRQEKIVDEEMKKKFNNAKSAKEEKEHLKAMAERVLKTMSDTIDSNTAELGRLAEEYSNLSLSGSFSGQVEKAVVMLEQNYEALKEKNVDEVTLNKVQESLNTMKQKLEVLKKARE
ncbi:hypothetical protein M422DRAFT_86445, partial [Sphaerobolus stellatus SS14]